MPMVYTPSATVTAIAFVGQVSAGGPLPLRHTGSEKMKISSSGIFADSVTEKYPERDTALASLNNWG